MANPLKSIERGIMGAMAKVLPPCSDVSQLMSKGMDSDLTARQKLTLRVHLALCGLCRRYNKQIHLLHSASEHYADPKKNDESGGLSDEAKERLKRALKR